MLQITGMDEIDRKEFETVANYLEGKHSDLGKRWYQKTIEASPKQLLQMANTIRRALALANKV